MACQSKNDCCLIYRGKVYVAERTECCPAFKAEEMRHIGNVTELSIDQSINKITQKDYTSLAGGNYCTAYEVEEANLSMTVGCADRKVLQMATSGSVEVLDSEATVTGEVLQIKAGADGAYFDLLPSETVSPVITSADGAVTYAEGVDYTVTKYGIEIVEGGDIDLAAQADSDEELELLAGYIHEPQTVIKGLISSGSSYYVVVNGYNKQTGKPMQWVFPNVRFSPASGIDIIQDEFATFELEGELLSDPCREGDEKYLIKKV